MFEICEQIYNNLTVIMCIAAFVIVGLYSLRENLSKPHPNSYHEGIFSLVAIIVFLYFSFGWFIFDFCFYVPEGKYRVHVEVTSSSGSYTLPADIERYYEDKEYFYHDETKLQHIAHLGITRLYWPNGGYIYSDDGPIEISFGESTSFIAQDEREYIVFLPTAAYQELNLSITEKLFPSVSATIGLVIQILILYQCVIFVIYIHKQSKSNLKLLDYYNVEFTRRFSQYSHPYTQRPITSIQEYLDALDSAKEKRCIITKNKRNVWQLEYEFSQRFGDKVNPNTRKYVTSIQDYLDAIDAQRKISMQNYHQRGSTL